ncbi:MAG: hypothetical protein HEQ17_14840 [Limnohabitans sp.]|jgi:hypothetical protein|uniref:hypothetical protein n=1 Tax=Limnohabitans sp. TaxID=1907725 RepID=UPI0025E4A7B9|nr:hypothetical protein [Limnohabitans sp.]MCO4090135.1 hypothetical protein [Limnohabitans sp.]
MIGNDRLYLALRALATAEGDVRKRVCLAMNIIEPIRQIEFSKRTDLWIRLDELKKETSSKGPQIINGKVLKDAYHHTCINRPNKTYKKYAEEIMDIWLETCE